MYVHTYMSHAAGSLSVRLCTPCLLAAHKKDEWIAVDPRSGAKLYTVSSAGVNSYCSADGSGEDAILLGKSCELLVHFVCCMQCWHMKAVVGRAKKHTVAQMGGWGSLTCQPLCCCVLLCSHEPLQMFNEALKCRTRKGAESFNNSNAKVGAGM